MTAPSSNELFVGRESELSQLCRYLDEAREGRGAIALVAGERGIGKTLLLNQLTAYAGANGTQVLIGQCNDDEGAPPYWPWIQAFRSYFAKCPPDDLLEQLGAGVTLIAGAMPDVREWIPELPPVEADLNPESARFRLFDAIAQFLRRAAIKFPILLVLEDLHWADEPSLRLLAFVSRQLERTPLMVAGSYRDVELRRTHALYRVLGEIASVQRYSRVLLRGWSKEETARYLELSAGGELQESLVADLHHQTEGTPLFVAEVTRLLADEGRLRPQSNLADWTYRIPEGIKEVIGRRLDRLSADCRASLKT